MLDIQFHQPHILDISMLKTQYHQLQPKIMDKLSIILLDLKTMMEVELLDFQSSNQSLLIQVDGNTNLGTVAPAHKLSMPQLLALDQVNQLLVMSKIKMDKPLLYPLMQTDKHLH